LRVAGGQATSAPERFEGAAMTGIGTFRTCRDSLTMSVDGGKADFPPHGRDFRF
jgi:hypothetical protein